MGFMVELRLQRIFQGNPCDYGHAWTWNPTNKLKWQNNRIH